MADKTDTTDDVAYRVLARKYRPTTFAELIGQEALVRTLTNAIATGRLHHAFVLTGVRGVGKTTTARIIARAFNCIGTDGTGGPTADPCGVCEHCAAIAEDRHVDVIEMDAASRTGVDDIRELIEGVRYRPTSARYKVYIIDEVHMLSKNAFNALLKTLEEPPEHVKFIFATTEIRKVPVTVLSRCQRFDLRRVETDVLAEHFSAIAKKEGADVSDTAVHLIARAADGSVRDGLSLLDQAIAHGSGPVDDAAVRAMMGLADRTLTFDLLDAVMRGETGTALGILADQHAGGADAAQVIEDLMELVHWLTRIKVLPTAADDAAVPEMERTRGRDMATALSMADLTRAWSLLLKGLGEVRTATRPGDAAEMILIRLAYAAALPSPAEALAKLGDGGAASSSASPARASSSAGASAQGTAPVAAVATETPSQGQPQPGVQAQTQPQAQARTATPAPDGPATGPVGQAEALAPEPVPEPVPDPETIPPAQGPVPRTFADVVQLAADKREGILRASLVNDVHLVSFEPGRIAYRPGEHADRDLTHRLMEFLNANTPLRWVVSISRDAGEAPLRQQWDATEAAEKAAVKKNPLVTKVLDTFPGAKVERVIRPKD